MSAHYPYPMSEFFLIDAGNWCNSLSTSLIAPSTHSDNARNICVSVCGWVWVSDCVCVGGVGVGVSGCVFVVCGCGCVCG